MINKDIDKVLEATSIKPFEGTNKVTTLERAIAEHVRPKMNIYISPEGGAAICQLIRQFWGTKPAFTLTMAAITEHALNLVYCGLVSKLITSNCSHIYPSPGVSGIIQEALRKGEIEIENWSLYTHLQRLMAGAQGIGFLPTKSLIKSSMAKENDDSFLVIDDPFESGRKVGLVKALNPEIGIVHGWASDPYGNTILVPISSQISTDHKMWGAKASTKGVIVTVEKLVSTEFIRKYSSLVTLPGYVVNSVCHVPFGAHPQGMFNIIPDLFESYAPDYEFVSSHRKACKSGSGIDEWIKKWVLNCRSHEEYVQELGSRRTDLLRERAAPEYWKRNLRDYIDKSSSNGTPNETEMMILVAAQIIEEIALNNNYKVLLGGIGSGMLASWVAYYMLRKKDFDVDLVVGTGTFGFAPQPGDPFYGTYSNLPSCKAFFDTADIYGFVMGGEHRSCLSVLGAAQIDRFGNINSTKLEDSFLMGSGGANDNAVASEALVVAKQSKLRFVDRVSYITCPGDNVKTIVSDMGVFQKMSKEEEFTLTGCLPFGGKAKLSEKIRRIQERCGWKIRIAHDVKEYLLPGEENVLLLRLFDPDRLVLKE